MVTALTLSLLTNKFSISLKQFQKILNPKTILQQYFSLKNNSISVKEENKSQMMKI